MVITRHGTETSDPEAASTSQPTSTAGTEETEVLNIFPSVPTEGQPPAKRRKKGEPKKRQPSAAAGKPEDLDPDTSEGEEDAGPSLWDETTDEPGDKPFSKQARQVARMTRELEEAAQEDMPADVEGPAKEGTQKRFLQLFEEQTDEEFLVAMKGKRIPPAGASFAGVLTDPAADSIHLARRDGHRYKITAAAVAREWEVTHQRMERVATDHKHLRPAQVAQQLAAEDYSVRVVKVNIDYFSYAIFLRYTCP